MYKNIAAAWIKKTKKGESYISFKAEVDIKAGQSISLFKNDKGGNQSRPDYRAYEKTDDAPKADVNKDYEETMGEELASQIPF